MEGINFATHRQIVINFYQKNQAKGKPYIVKHFRKLGVTRRGRIVGPFALVRFHERKAN